MYWSNIRLHNKWVALYSLTNELRDKKEVVRKITAENSNLTEQLTSLETKQEKTEQQLLTAKKVRVSV